MQNTEKYPSNKRLFMQVGLMTVGLAALVGGFAITPSYGQVSRYGNPYQVVGTVPIEFTVGSVCGGEEVTVRGTALVVSHLTVTPDGTRENQLDHFSLQGVSGTTASGDTVILTQASTSSIRRVNSDQSLVSATVEIHETHATQGNTANAIANIQFIVTFNANGQPTVSITNFDVKCVG